MLEAVLPREQHRSLCSAKGLQLVSHELLGHVLTQGQDEAALQQKNEEH